MTLSYIHHSFQTTVHPSIKHRSFVLLPQHSSYQNQVSQLLTHLLQILFQQKVHTLYQSLLLYLYPYFPTHVPSLPLVFSQHIRCAFYLSVIVAYPRLGFFYHLVIVG